MQFVGQGRIRAQVEQESRHQRNRDIAEDQDDLGHDPHGCNAHNVACDEEERFLGRVTEAVAEDGRLYVGVLVEELQALFQAP